MEKFIYKWLNSGIINEKTADILLKDISEEKARQRRIKLNICIYTIAAVLIGTGIIAFIAANEWLLSLFMNLPILQIGLLTAITVALLFFGYKTAYEWHKFPKLGHSMIFLSSVLIGATYALIGQNYHINANNCYLIFLWLLSILPLSYIYNSFAINVLSIILFIWGIALYYGQLSINPTFSLFIYLPVLTGASLYTIGNIPFIIEKFNKFSLSYKITGIVPIFITLLLLTCSYDKLNLESLCYYILPLVLLIFLNLIIFIFNKNKNLLLKTETSFILILLISLFLLITLPKTSTLIVMIFAHILIITMISAGYNYGYKLENNNFISIINKFLIIYLIVNYCRWGWNMLDKSLFFIIGGVCLLSLGMFLENRRKKIINKDS